MRCYICDVLLQPRKIQMDPLTKKHYPCTPCRNAIAEDLKADEITVVIGELELGEDDDEYDCDKGGVGTS